MGRNFRVGASGKRGEVTPGVARAQVYKYQDGQHNRFTQVVGSPRGWGVCVSAAQSPGLAISEARFSVASGACVFGA